MTPAEVSASLRRKALDMKPFDAATAADEPFGFVSEFLQGESVVTMTAFSTGDASIYFSGGGGILGLIGKPEVAELARNTVEALRPLVPQLERSDDTDRPQVGDYCFYVLTPAGRRLCRVNASGKAPRNSPQ